MSIVKEIWSSDIVENLFKNNEFANRAVNADSFVLGGAVVHKPIAGAPTKSKKNLTTFPQTAVTRQDTDKPYALDTYYALPKRIPELAKYELSYDLRQSVVGEDEQQLIQDAMDGLLINWGSTSTNKLLTTGAATAADLIDDTATGTRNLFTKDSIKTVAKRWANANFRGQKWTALLTANHYYQFFESLSDAEKTNFGKVADLSTGVVGSYMNVDIIMRSDVLRYRKVGSNYTLVDTQADSFAPDAADCAASLFYTDKSVERAKGSIEVFDNPGQALYYGDIFSAFLRLGGRTLREAGVYSVIEAVGA